MRSEATRERNILVVTIREVMYEEAHFEKAGVNGGGGLGYCSVMWEP